MSTQSPKRQLPRSPGWLGGRPEPRRERSRQAVTIGGRDATWLRAPLGLLRHGSVLLAVGASALLLALVVAAGPLFRSAAGSAALERRVAQASRWKAGLTVVAYGPMTGRVGRGLTAEALLRRQERYLTGQAGAVRGLASPTLTVLGSSVTVRSSSTAAVPAAVQLLFRSGFPSRLVVASRASATGVWLPSSVADRIGVRAGDTVLVGSGQRTGSVPVAGVYRALSSTTDFWLPLSDLTSGTGGGQAPLPLVPADLGTLTRLSGEFDQVVEFTWEVPFSPRGISLPQARGVAADLARIEAGLAGQDPAAAPLFAGASHESGLAVLVADAEGVRGTLDGPVATVSLAGVLAVLVMFGAAGRYGVRRRRAEMALLSARGTGPVELGSRAALEAALPVAVGTALGVALGFLGVKILGPGGAIDPGSVRWAVVLSAGMALVALGLFGVVAGLAGARAAEAEERSGRFREAVSGAPWEVVVLALAAVSYAEIAARGGRTGRIDVLVLLFPTLFVAGMAGLAGRLLLRFLPGVRRLGRRRGPAAYLALRRIGSAGRDALVLLTAATMAVGVLLFGSILASSLRATTAAKAVVLNGADVDVVLAQGAPAPGRLPFPSSVVERIPGATILPGAFGRADVLAVDPRTVLAAVREGGFSGPPLERLLSGLGRVSGSRLPAVVVGSGLPSGATLELAGSRFPLSVAGRASAFPGMGRAGTVLVVERRGLDAALARAGLTLGGAGGQRELWAMTNAARVSGELRQRGVPFTGVTTAAGIRAEPRFLAADWALGLFRALGVVMAIGAAVTALAYAGARARRRVLAHGLATRMGLKCAAERRSIALELVGLLGASFALGAVLALAATVLVLGRVDLVPAVPPAPILRLPWPVLGGTAGGLVVVAWTAAAKASRALGRGDVAKAMRRAG